MSTPAFPASSGLPPHPLSLGDVLTAAFRFYGRRFGQLIVIALIPTLVSLVTAAIAIAFIVGAVIRVLAGSMPDGVPSFDSTTIGLLVGGIVLLLAISVISALVKVKCQGMIALAGRDIEDGRTSTVGDLWRRTRGLAGRAVLLVLLLTVAILVIAAVFFGLATAIVDTGSSGLGALVVVLTIALIVVAIFLQIRWAFVLQTLAIDGDGPIAALGRSWRISRGSFWRIFGYLLVANILVGIAAGAISGISQGMLLPRMQSLQEVDSVSAMLAQLASLAPFFLISTVGSEVIALLSGPFLVLFTTVLYIDQRRRLGLEAVPASPQEWGPGYAGPGQPGGPYPGGPYPGGPHPGGPYPGGPYPGGQDGPGGEGGPQGRGYPYGG
ncbi:hypothetical protein [Raineyella sp.]|uniref:DUF7847 domain-containing protein n=1 Tax=bioreactor metagenome TaxID=1076179 RepID=A0A645AGX9_9ZZZZ|nr:hypothetical protein [Raineyella sp.]MEA5153395.1 hypothetical protein [Raineyella sp.]